MEAGGMETNHKVKGIYRSGRKLDKLYWLIHMIPRNVGRNYKKIMSLNGRKKGNVEGKQKKLKGRKCPRKTEKIKSGRKCKRKREKS